MWRGWRGPTPLALNAFGLIVAKIEVSQVLDKKEDSA
jgi:hypothetical protein